MKIVSVIFTVCVAKLIILNTVKSEVFTAITDLIKLLHSHDEVTNSLKFYINAEQIRIKELERYLKEFTDVYDSSKENHTNYFENPINSFRIIKKLSGDFDKVREATSNPTEFVYKQDLVYPTQEDLTGAAVAIARLQHFYKLNVTELANGNLNGQTISSPMTANDCYILAMNLYNKGGFYSHAAEWFEAALEKLNNDQGINSLDAAQVVKYIIKSHHHSEMPLNPKAYEWTLKLNSLSEYVWDDNDLIIDHYNTAISNENVTSSSDNFAALCRDDIDYLIENSSKLHCSYLKRTPFLRLAPIKTEEIHKNPNVYLFYEVLSENEVENIKTLAGPKLQRAKVHRNNGSTTDYRISKSAWLNKTLDFIEKLYRRTAEFTGLSMAHAEDLQVLNYGVGGHYDTHYDAFGEHATSAFTASIGDRIATVLFYMSDVTIGGSTAFVNLDLVVKPKRGMALFWENLHPSGEVNQDTMHGACPVLYGNKWVSNIWIHEGGQELIRPCPLNSCVECTS